MRRIEWYNTRIKEARKEAQEAMKRVQSLWKKETKFREYQKDKKVWLEVKIIHTTHPTTKLRPKRYGPFKIMEAISPVAYQLNLPEQWNIHNVFHVSLLTPYKETEEHGPNYEGQIPKLVEGQEEWEVEKVLDSRRYGRTKKLQYLLKWKGYPEAENTWQDKKDVFASQLIDKYHKENPTAIRTTRLQKEELMDNQGTQPPITSLVKAFSQLTLSPMPSTSLPTPSHISVVSTHPNTPEVHRIPPRVEVTLTSEEGSIPSVEELLVPPGLGINEAHKKPSTHWEGSRTGGEALGFQEPVWTASEVPDEGTRGTGATLTEGLSGLPPPMPASTGRSLEEEITPTPASPHTSTSQHTTKEPIGHEGDQEEDDHPGEGWVRWNPSRGFTKTEVLQERSYKWKGAKYQKFAIQGGNPKVFSTMGKGQLEYGESLHATPSQRTFPWQCNQEDLEKFELDQYFQD
jgi:Chromo (CHRromatin Organisation MOdifier) domain